MEIARTELASIGLSVHVIEQDGCSMEAEGGRGVRGRGQGDRPGDGADVKTLFWEKEGERAALGPGPQRG